MYSLKLCLYASAHHRASLSSCFFVIVPSPAPALRDSQVTLMEDEDQRFHFRNLTTHRVNTEEDALNLVSGCAGNLLHNGSPYGVVAGSSAGIPT